MKIISAAVFGLVLAAFVPSSPRHPLSAEPAGDPAPAASGKPLVDNDRVTLRDVTWTGVPPAEMLSPAAESLWVSLAPTPGEVAHWSKGQTRALKESAGRAIVIDLKDHPVPPIPNASGFPNAFPRPGSRKVLENDRVVVWDYTWTAGQATPVHFHDKDVVVVYLGSGTLRSTTPDGKTVVSSWAPGDTRFNLRDRVHTETLVDGQLRAILTELK